MKNVNDLYAQKIQTFLDKDSGLNLQKVRKGETILIKMGQEYRPDRIFGTNAGMKMAMIASGIDSPWQLVANNIIASPDNTTLLREFNTLDEGFKI